MELILLAASIGVIMAVPVAGGLMIWLLRRNRREMARRAAMRRVIG